MIYRYQNDGLDDQAAHALGSETLLVKKKNPLVGILLFLISILLSGLTLWLGFIVGLIYTIIKGRVGEYFLEIATSIDQNGNVVMQHILNMTMVTSKGYLFGNKDETISSAIGKNKKLGTLSNFGKWIDRILDAIDPNHSLSSIEYYVEGKNEIKSAQELEILLEELTFKFPDVDFSKITLRPQNVLSM